MQKVDLEKFTKQELLYLFNTNKWRLLGVDYKVQIEEFRRMRAEKKESDALSDAIAARRAYIEWITKFEGMKISDIPDDEISKGVSLEIELKKADSKYQRLSSAGEKNKYV